MKAIYGIWRTTCYLLFVSSTLFLLGVLPNTLFTNALVFCRAYLPFNTRVNFASEYNRYAINIKDAEYIIKTNTITICNKSFDKECEIMVDGPTLYAFNYSELYIKVLDQNNNEVWIAPYFSRAQSSNKIHFIHVAESEVFSHHRLIKIDLANHWRGWKKIETFNRIILLPFFWVISVVLYLCLYFRKSMKGPRQYTIDNAMGVIICVFPLFIFLLYKCVCWGWQLGLWIYTCI